MSAALAMRDAIVATIKATIPSLKTCEPHGGKFDTAELGRYFTAAPAVYVTCLGKAKMLDMGYELHAPWTWAAFVVASDLPKLGAVAARPKADVAHALSEVIAALVAAQNWSGTAAKASSNIEIANLYTGSGDAKGVTFWSVTWTQPTSIQIGVDTATLPDFLTAHTSWDLAPKGDDDADPDAEDDLTLPTS